MKKLLFLSICVILFTGCDLAEPQGKKERGGGSPLAEAVTGMGVAEEMQGDAVAAPEQNEEPAKEPETERVKLEKGFTGKGQYGQAGGENPTDIITVPVGQYFTIQERLMIMQLQDAMNKYKAMNDDKAPATHEDYMRDIINAYGIKLKDLPEGHKYVYNPKTAELEIEKPK